MKRVDALDGIRALAILPVLAIHSSAPFGLGGQIGVDIFFVLSGYLITSLLASEFRAHGQIDVLAFYKRRAVRLYPTLLLMLAAFLVVAPFAWPGLPALHYAAIAATYLTDYVRAFGGIEVVAHTWSLAVEEHFYLLWPLVVPLLLRHRNPIRVLCLAYVLATIWRFANYEWLGFDHAYYRFDTRLSGLILGSTLALGLRFKQQLPAVVPWSILAIGALTTWHTTRQWTAMVSIVIAEWVSAALILAATAGARGTSLLACRPIAYLGRLSYGIYLWHLPIMALLTPRYGWLTSLVVGSASGIALAALTYHFVDLPIRRFRERHQRSTPSAAAGTSPLPLV